MKMKAASFFIGITIFGVILLITPLSDNAQAGPWAVRTRPISSIN